MMNSQTESVPAGEWVDFKQLREQLDFLTLLRHYRVAFKISGDQATGLCPLPDHPTHEGKKRTASFSANLRRGIWQCFGCGAKGNVLDFAVRMEAGSPENAADVRRVGLTWQGRIGHLSKSVDRRSPPKPEPPKPQTPTSESEPVINAPLDFELKRLDTGHAYLKGRGMTEPTIARFGLGFCNRGMMAGRIAIPLHDASGRLIGYAGRLVDDSVATDENPKYRFPGRRVRDGVTYDFRKSMFLYNGYSIRAPVADLVVVEGFPSVWWLWQHGYQNVAGLMGSSVSEVQANLIVNSVAPDGHVWIMPDGDEAGERCATEVFNQVAWHRFVRWAKLETGRQPTDLSGDVLARSLPDTK